MLFGTYIEGVIVHTECEWVDLYCMAGISPEELPDNVYVRHKKNSVNIYRVLVPDNIIPDMIHFMHCQYRKLSPIAISNIEKHTCLPIDGQFCEYIYTHIYILALRRDKLVHDFIDNIDGEYLEPYLYTLSSSNFKDLYPYNIPLIK